MARPNEVQDALNAYYQRDPEELVRVVTKLIKQRNDKLFTMPEDPRPLEQASILQRDLFPQRV